jgi:hypothetical protein
VGRVAFLDDGVGCGVPDSLTVDSMLNILLDKSFEASDIVSTCRRNIVIGRGDLIVALIDTQSGVMTKTICGDAPPVDGTQKALEENS